MHPSAQEYHTNFDACIDSLSLAPNDFFSKKMNITREALASIFIFWQLALENFLNGHYSKHDALVGENACHIRAFVLYEISLLTKDNPVFLSVLKDTIAHLTNIVHSIETVTIDNETAKDSVETFLVKNELIFKIPKSFFFHIKYIIDSYLLTVTKESLPTTGLTLRERTSYQPVRDWGFAYNRAQYLVHNTQKVLSASSCEHILYEAELLNKPHLHQLLKIKKDAHGRSFIPQFFTAKVLFLRALQKNTPLLFKITRYFKHTPIDNICLLLKPNQKQTDFEVCSNVSAKDAPIVMIEGVVNYDSIYESLEQYQNRLLSKSILEVILANFAIHPQYSGDLKHLPPPFDEALSSLMQITPEPKSMPNRQTECDDLIVENSFNEIYAEKEDFERHRKYANEEGCSLDNPSLLFINHMYCENALNYAHYFDNIDLTRSISDSHFSYNKIQENMIS